MMAVRLFVEGSPVRQDPRTGCFLRRVGGSAIGRLLAPIPADVAWVHPSPGAGCSPPPTLAALRARMLLCRYTPSTPPSVSHSYPCSGPHPLARTSQSQNCTRRTPRQGERSTFMTFDFFNDFWGAGRRLGFGRCIIKQAKCPTTDPVKSPVK